MTRRSSQPVCLSSFSARLVTTFIPCAGCLKRWAAGMACAVSQHASVPDTVTRAAVPRLRAPA